MNAAHLARIAGALYLVVVAASVFALFALSGLIVRDDAAATAANIVASEQMVRLAFAANLLAGATYVAVIALFYRLFYAVNPALSAVAAFLGIAGCAVSAATMLLSAPEIAAAFSPDQTHALARMALRLGAFGNNIGLVFFGFYCLTLGWLALGARFLPRILGALLLIAGAGWLVGSFAAFLVPDIAAGFARTLIAVSGLGELIFALWLVVTGVDEAKWRAQVS